MICAQCGRKNRAQAHFCDACGASLREAGDWRYSQRTLQAIIDALPHPIYLKTADGTYVFVNQAMADHHGLAVEAFRGLHTSGLPNRSPEELAVILDADRAVLASEARVDVPEIEVHLAHGRTAWQRMVKVPLRGPDGTVSGIVGLAEDITQRVEAERMVQRLHGRLIDAIESLPTAFTMYDADERLVYWNRKTEEFFPHLQGRLKQGMPHEEILAMGYEDLGEPKPPRDDWMAERRRFFRDPPDTYEQTLRSRRHTQVSQRRTSDGGRVRIHVDISEQKAIQERLEQARERIERDLAFASEFQQSLLPQIPTTPFLRIEGRHLPLERVSGDLYDLSRGGDGELRFFIGDATGHDITAAFLTMMARVGLEGARSLPTPAAVMERLNALMAPMHLQGRYVSGLFLRIDPDGRLTVCNAGHPPLVLLPAGEPAPTVMWEGSTALGLFTDPALPFQEQSWQLRRGDRVLALTDGLIEWSNEGGTQFGLERLLECLAEHAHHDLPETVDGLIAAGAGFADGQPREDDLTLFCFQYEGAPG